MRESSPVTLLYIVGFVVLAIVLLVTSEKPRRWLERRYWRRQRQNR